MTVIFDFLLVYKLTYKRRKGHLYVVKADILFVLHDPLNHLCLVGRRGIVVFITAYGAKGRRFESRSFLFFHREQPVSPIEMHSRNARRPRENEKIKQLRVEQRENAGAARRRRRTSRQTWQEDMKNDLVRRKNSIKW